MLFFDQIASNQRKSFLLIFLFVLLLAAMGYVFGELSHLGYGPGLVVALLIAGLSIFGSYYYSDRIILGISGARPLQKQDHPHLFHTVEGLALASGMSPPRIYVINDMSPNAFATGRNPQNGVIAITTGLLGKLNRVELEGVIAHEMAHIKNYDILLGSLAAVLCGAVIMLSDMTRRIFFYGGGRRYGGGGRRSGSGGGGGGIFILAAIVMSILAPFAAHLIRLAISRKREYLADATAVMLTRYPPGLTSALRKLASDRTPVSRASRATAHLYTVNPLKSGGRIKLFSTHPPIQERIAVLEAM